MLWSVGFPCGSDDEDPAYNEGQEDPLEKGMATHSSILTWPIPMDKGALWATVYKVTRVGHD